MNTKRHGREDFFVANEGVLTQDEKGANIVRPPSAVEATRKFLFSRIGPQGPQPPETLLPLVAAAMAKSDGTEGETAIPAGYTYLGQFVDHDLTLDKTAAALGTDVTMDDLVQGRTSALDLDSLYGLGPNSTDDARLYATPTRFKLGRTQGTRFPANDPVAFKPLDGHDLPRVGKGPSPAERRTAEIGDPRNDENLIVAQTHLAFLRFHNAVVTELEKKVQNPTDLFEQARAEVVKHYQWMLREDFLPRICDPAVVNDVFTHGRKIFEPQSRDDRTTMPLEFSVGAFRLGHSMIRRTYDWNRVFGPALGTLENMFKFSGKSGDLTPPNESPLEHLPTNWVADWRRLFDFRPHIADPAFAPPGGRLNVTEKINTLLTPILAELPPGSFNGDPATTGITRNLAFRNLARARMVKLATGQQMAAMCEVKPLDANQIAKGDGADLTGIAGIQPFLENTPLWFYVLREAEVHGKAERLGPVGSRIVAETMHRAMEASMHSIVREPAWRPTFGDKASFTMVHLLLTAFGRDIKAINPLG